MPHMSKKPFLRHRTPDSGAFDQAPVHPQPHVGGPLTMRQRMIHMSPLCPTHAPSP